MTLTKDNRTGYYKANIRTVTGKVRSVSMKTTNLEDAKRAAKDSKIVELEAAAKTGRLTADVIGRLTADKKVTCQAAMEKWLAWRQRITKRPNTLDRDRTYLALFLRECSLESTPPASIKHGDIQDYIDRSGHRKLSTRKMQMAGLRSFFDFCCAESWAFTNPARIVKVSLSLLDHRQKETRSRHPFTDVEIERLLKATAPDGEYADTFWHAAIAIARYTGLRLGDVCGIEWASFEVPGKVIVWTAKRDKRVELPLEPAALANAVGAVIPNMTPYLFPKEAEQIRCPKTRAKFSVQFGRLCQRFDILGKSYHDLRSSYCLDAVKRGIPLEHIAQSVGHSSTATTIGYLGRGE